MMKKSIKYSLLCIFLCIICSCDDVVKIYLPRDFNGWVYILESKKIRDKSHVYRPDSFGVIYLDSIVFNTKRTVSLIVDNKEYSLSEIGLHRGEYYGSSSEVKLRYYKFHYPYSGYSSNEISIGSNNTLLTDIEALIEKGGIDTCKVW